MTHSPGWQVGVALGYELSQACHVGVSFLSIQPFLEATWAFPQHGGWVTRVNVLRR